MWPSRILPPPASWPPPLSIADIRAPKTTTTLAAIKMVIIDIYFLHAQAKHLTWSSSSNWSAGVATLVDFSVLVWKFQSDLRFLHWSVLSTIYMGELVSLICYIVLAAQSVRHRCEGDIQAARRSANHRRVSDQCPCAGTTTGSGSGHLGRRFTPLLWLALWEEGESVPFAKKSFKITQKFQIFTVQIY